nr:immunoglobulin mu heavy chain [Rachycentron canadum]
MFSVALLLLLAAGSCVKCQQLTQPASVTVQPGQRLTITCQVFYSVSSYATAWIRQPAGKRLEWIGIARVGYTSYYKDSLKHKFSIDLDSSNNRVTLNGQNMQPEDSAVYYCASRMVGDAFDYWGKGTMVTVTSATAKGPTLFPLIQCASGSASEVTLGCLATDFTPSSLTFTWKKDQTDLTDFIQYPSVQKGAMYTGVSQIRVRRQDWDAGQSFHCIATHVGGNDNVTIAKPLEFVLLPTLRALVSSDDANEATFSCFAKDFSPKDHEIKWLKHGMEISPQHTIQTFTGERRLENGTVLYSAANFLSLKTNELTENTELTCLFKLKTSNGDMFTNSSVTYNSKCVPGEIGCIVPDVNIDFEGPTLKDIFSKKKGTIKCHVTINKPSVDKVFWEDQWGNELSYTVDSSNGKKVIVSLDITYDEWSKGIKRFCVVEHSNFPEPIKKIYERHSGEHTVRPSVFMLPPVEHTKTNTVTLTCYVKDFFPEEVYVSWLVDDEAADSRYKFSTTNPVRQNGSYSAYGQLSLDADEWKNNKMVYSCVVYHESVVNSCNAIIRSIGQRTFESTNLVNLNMNIPETCKAQ